MRSGNDLFEWQIQRHVDAAFNLARWLLGNDSDAEDVVQESLVKAYQAFGKFRGSDGKPWFLAIVRNGCFRHRSRSRATVTLEDELQEPATMGTPETEFLRTVDAEAVQAGIASLPEAFREVLVLREFEDMSYAEISQVLEVPTGTVMSRLSRARSMLAERLKAGGLP